MSSCLATHLPMVLAVLPLSLLWSWGTFSEPCGSGAVEKHYLHHLPGQTPAWVCHYLLHRVRWVTSWPSTPEFIHYHIKMPTLLIYSAVGIVTLCAGQDDLHPYCQESLLRVHGDSLEVWLTTAFTQNQRCAKREGQLFIVGIQCHTVPAHYLVPYHPTYFCIAPYYKAPGCHAGTIFHSLSPHFVPLQVPCIQIPQKSFVKVFHLSQPCWGLLWALLF